jgi:hypothetical protein
LRFRTILAEIARNRRIPQDIGKNSAEFGKSAEFWWKYHGISKFRETLARIARNLEIPQSSGGNSKEFENSVKL